MNDQSEFKLKKNHGFVKKNDTFVSYVYYIKKAAKRNRYALNGKKEKKPSRSAPLLLFDFTFSLYNFH